MSQEMIGGPILCPYCREAYNSATTIHICAEDREPSMTPIPPIPEDLKQTRDVLKADIIFHRTKDACGTVDSLIERIAKLTAERDEFERKGQMLCNAYGNALVEIHDLKAVLAEIEKYAIHGCGTKQKDIRGKQFAAIVDLASRATRTPPQEGQ